MSFDINLIV